MILIKLFTMLLICFLAGLVAAMPASDLSDAKGRHCPSRCVKEITGCLIQNTPEYCHHIMCGILDLSCQACRLCELRTGTTVDSTEVVNTVKREPDSDQSNEQCVIICGLDDCRRQCFAANAALPDDLDGALVIHDTNVGNGTISIKRDNDANLISVPVCPHWICTLHGCKWMTCGRDPSTEAVGNDIVPAKRGAEAIPPTCPSCVCWTCPGNFCWAHQCGDDAVPDITEEEAIPHVCPTCVYWTCNGHFCWAHNYSDSAVTAKREVEVIPPSCPSCLCWACNNHFCWAHHCSDDAASKGDQVDVTAN